MTFATGSGRSLSVRPKVAISAMVVWSTINLIAFLAIVAVVV